MPVDNHYMFPTPVSGKLHCSLLLQGGDPAPPQRVQAGCEAGEGGGHARDQGGGCSATKQSLHCGGFH